jgi:dipeptide transport system ATP-binding protein
MSLLEIRNLSVDFQTAHGLFRAVDGVHLDIDEGDLVAIVGESGSGKSVSMLAVMGLLPWTAKVTADRLAFGGRDLLTLGSRARRRIIGKEMSMIFQEPMTSSTPASPSASRSPSPCDAPRRLAGRASPPRHRAARLGGHPGARYPALRLSAPDVGRHEPARDDRHGDRLQPAPADRRRADDGARRHHPGADPRAAGSTCSASAAWPGADHP